MNNSRTNPVVCSALWAAYGDALGFITELADARLVRQRIHDSRVFDTVEWRRNVGGKFGATVELPAGAYSDDTQLRLATSRAIRQDGYFDVESFAKIELPVWLSYSLGAGSATKSAATSLASVDVNWFSNFYKNKGTNYFDAGGNGAAMRIQPHVWNQVGRDLTSKLRDVARNTLSTHGHPRALVGAYFHACCLDFSLRHREIPGLNAWKDMLSGAANLFELIKKDEELAIFWLPVWESRTNISFKTALQKIEQECRCHLEDIGRISASSPAECYSEALQILEARSPSWRGSGTRTAILASLLAWYFRTENPKTGLVIAANALGTDTDTIATMAGAILGAASAEEPLGAMQDRDYLVREAQRLAGPRRMDPFRYPDLMQWRAPKTALDAVTAADGAVRLVGLGWAKPIGQLFTTRGKEDVAWQWVELEFGQTVLAKQRTGAHIRSGGTDVKEAGTSKKGPTDREDSQMKSQQQLFDSTKPTNSLAESRVRPPDLDLLTTEAIRSGFKEELIGRHLLMLASAPNGLELAIGYASVIAKARKARLNAEERKT